MPVRLLTACILLAIVVGVALSAATGTPDVHEIQFLIVRAHAQSKQQNPLEKARKAVETLINRLRGLDMPEGIVKTNGRIEATQVDVAAKYPGRLATLTVNEGDEVTAGQVVATISSPETEAQLRGAQAQVLKAKQALAEAVALIAQRKSDLDFTRSDYARGKALLERGNISQQTVDQRRNKLETAESGYVAANAQRDAAEADLAIAWLNEKARPHVEPLAMELEAEIRAALDVSKAGELELLRKRAPESERLPLSELKDIIRRQATLLRSNEKKAISTISKLLPDDPEARRRTLTAIYDVISAAGELDSAEATRFENIKRLFGMTELDATKTNSRRRDEQGLTRMKPVSKPEAHEKYQRLIDAAKAAGPVSTAVAHPCDEVSLKGAIEATRLRLIDPILVGPTARIQEIARRYDIDISGLRIVNSLHSHNSAAKAVELARNGEAEALMKGSLHTDEIMGAVVAREGGIRTSRRISHCFIMDVPGHPDPLIITDAAVNIAPTLEEKIDIVQNAIDLANALPSARGARRGSLRNRDRQSESSIFARSRFPEQDGGARADHRRRR